MARFPAQGGAGYRRLVVFMKWVRRRQARQIEARTPWAHEPAVVFGLSPEWEGKRYSGTYSAACGAVPLWKDLMVPFTVNHLDESGGRLTVTSQPLQSAGNLGRFGQQALENAVRLLVSESHGKSATGDRAVEPKDFEDAVAAMLEKVSGNPWVTRQVIAGASGYELDVCELTSEMWVAVARIDQTMCSLRGHRFPVEDVGLAAQELA